MNSLLAANMVETYRQQAAREVEFLAHAEGAPALFKPDGIRAAQLRIARAAREMGRWSR
jgi:hypothetical protein